MVDPNKLSEMVENLENFLLIPPIVDECDKISARKQMENAYDELELFLLNKDFWNIFLDANYDISILKIILTSKNDEEQQAIFRFGIACLVGFARANFIEPHLSGELQEFLQMEAFSSYDFYKMLSVNNEDLNAVAEFPQLLITAKIIFEWCRMTNKSTVNVWWYSRSIYIHQQCLDELSPTLLLEADRLYKFFQINQGLQDNVRIAIDLEIAHLYLLFRHVSKAKENIDAASNLLNLKYDYVGILGKRTRYQEKDLAQLALKIDINDNSSENNTEDNASRPVLSSRFDVTLNTDESILPKNVQSNDNVLLEHIAFADNENESVVLPSLGQKLFLTLVQEILISKPQDELQMEELLPFIEMILAQKNTFCVRVMGLLLRCKFESKNKRRMERALIQCEEILKSYHNENLHVCDRFNDIFSTGLPPLWKISAQYAEVLLNFGLVKNALDVYLKFESWEEIVLCYTILKMRHKATEVLKKQIKKGPTVKLWCLLGDATDDPSCYETAWELSKKRSHRAQRHWGNFLYNRTKYEECISHFEKSVSINPLQANVWFRLGYAALQTEKWQKAATAYKRYTTLEPDGFEAWNNLAQAYLRLGNKRSAHIALLEALKCSYENWKVWENFLTVSSDISMISDVIRAYHRLIDLKGKYLNLNVLAELVCEMFDDTIDCEGLPASRFLPKIRELLGRVTLLYPSDPTVWELYAKLAPTPLLKAHRYCRAYKCYVKIGHWMEHLPTCNQVIYICSELCDLGNSEELANNDVIKESIIANVTDAINNIKRQQHSEACSDMDNLSESLEILSQKLVDSSSAVLNNV